MLRIVVLSIILSRARPSFLAVTCIMAVRYDIGLKRALIQREIGAMSSSLYSSSCAILRRRSSHQFNKSFFEAYAYFSQRAGT
jgi:hypothetical protein